MPRRVCGQSSWWLATPRALRTRTGELAEIAADGGDLSIDALGSGSDFTPFLQHLGIASLNIGYDGEADEEGVYHSKYDSFDHYLRFGDPGFVYGIAQAQTVGHLVLRMAQADVLPLQFTAFSAAIQRYMTELHDLVDQKRRRVAELDRLFDQNAFQLSADPTRRVLPPEREPPVPYLNFGPLDDVVGRLQKSAAAYDARYAKLQREETQLSAMQRKKLNGLLRGMESMLTDGRGLPGRDWFKHLVYAPGLYTGYDVKTLPGVREAIEENRFDEANDYSIRTAAALVEYSDRLDEATKILGNTK